jgi:hypothetical protein
MIFAKGKDPEAFSDRHFGVADDFAGNVEIALPWRSKQLRTAVNEMQRQLYAA